MSIRIHREQVSRKSKRLELNSSTDDLDMHEYVKVRRVHVLEVNGERFRTSELKRILRAAKKCKCDECFDCQVALECKRSGWK